MSLDGYTEDLLMAVPSDASETLVAAVRDACVDSTVVRAAYIGRVRRLSPDGSDVQELRIIAVNPSQPLDHSDSTDCAVMAALAARLPMLDGRQEVARLNDNSLPAWQDRAICVFER